MRYVAAIAVVAILAPAAFAATNSVAPVDVEPRVEVHGGVADMSIVVYTDDCYGYDYVLAALDQLGYGYTLYYFDYYGFEAAVASGMYDLIITNHECYFELSYAWDDIYFELLNGKHAILHSFDWDGSHDYSGFAWDVLDLAFHAWYMDLQTATTVYAWAMDPFFTGTDGVLNPVLAGYYIDEGDYLSGTGYGGFTPDPSPDAVACNPPVEWCLIIIAFCMDEYDRAEIVQIWKNVITLIYMGASGADQTTWGGVKAMYR
jgi:hypothetical protein